MAYCANKRKTGLEELIQAWNGRHRTLGAYLQWNADYHAMQQQSESG